MSWVLLYKVDPSVADLLRGHATASTEFMVAATPEDVKRFLGDNPTAVDALIVGTSVANPIQTAQAAFALNRNLWAIILAEPTHYKRLAEGVQFAPLIGITSVCVSIDNPERILETFNQAITAARHKRVFQKSIAAVDSQLGVIPPPLLNSIYIEHLLHHAPIGVVALDESGTVLSWNTFASQLTGVTERDAPGTLFPAIYPEPASSMLKQMIADVLIRPKTGSAPVTVEHEGTAVEITMSLLEENPRHKRLIAILRDITDQLKAEREAKEATRLLETTNKQLSKARDQALEASRAKSTFLANMSHELRTPLNAIIGYSEMLQEHAMQDERDELASDLGRISAAGRHLLMLISEVLDFSKIEAGVMELYVSKFDVRKLIDELTATLQPLFERNQNRLDVVCEDSLGKMQSDETKVRQVLFNLLSNAAKFTERGKVTLAVSRVAGEDGDSIVLSISDTGIGMSEKQIGSLFREFSQVDPSPTRRHGGSGLGLVISRRFSRMMGGDVDVTSKPGVGSTFTATIPAIAPGRTPLDAENAAAKDHFFAEEESEFPNYSPNTILVIDDDPAVHDMLRRTLEKERFRMVSAMEGKRGIELAREIVPRAIILDILMPDTDGWSVLNEIKSDRKLADIPVIIVSIIDHKNLGFALGATDYITKPIERHRLLSILRRYQCDLRQCSVMILEDDPDTRDLMNRLLVNAGCTTSIVGNGKEGLAELEKEIPDIILLDLMMPEMDGFEFLEKLRDEPRWKNIPVIVTTAKELDADDRRKLSGEVEKVLHKGHCTRDDLLREICDVVSKLEELPPPAS